VLRPDGTILARPGYDPDTGLLFEPGGIDFPKVPEKPSSNDVARALSLLLDLVDQFPFAGDAHQAAWLASLLTPLARFAIKGPCPLFLLDSNASGSGKTKLCDVVSILATGRPMARTSYPETNEEMDKRILAIALAGYRMILFDNLKTGNAIGGEALDAALTGMSKGGRILGRSEMAIDIPLFTVWYASGNNLGLQADALRRILPIRLECPSERPEERSAFRYPNLEDYVLRHRGELVAAALAILRANAVARFPEPEEPMVPWGGYEEWSRFIRRAVCFAWPSSIDPCSTREGIRAVDDMAKQLPGLNAGWERLCLALRKRNLTAAEAHRALAENPNEHTELRALLCEWSRDGSLPSPRSLGKRLQRIRGRVAGGKAIDFTPLHARALGWYVRESTPAK
jgi:putative DNA primase/helicase